MQYFIETAQKIREHHSLKRKEIADKNRIWANKSKRELAFSEGQIVYLKDFKIAEGVGKSIQPRYLGPFQNEKIYPNSNTTKLINLGNSRTRIAHLSHLKQSVGNFNQTIIPADLDPRMILQNSNNKKNEKKSQIIRKSFHH